MAKKRKQEPKPELEADADSDGEASGDAAAEPQRGGNEVGNEVGDGDGDGDSMSDDAPSSEEDDDDQAVSAPSAPAPARSVPPPPYSSVSSSDGRYRNRQRLLLLSSRGITARYRHLLEDLRTLIPHSKKESKLDVGKNYSGGGSGGGYGAAVNEIAEVRGCHTALFLECRRHGKDGYLWLGRTSHANSAIGGDADGEDGGSSGNMKRLMIAGGPSVKFHITNIHTMDELKMTGNCMKGSRPVLSFDRAFDDVDRLRLIKHLLVDAFGTPRGHPKSKPFVDRVMGFYYVDGKIWVRNYQILEEVAADAREAHSQKKLTGHAHSTSLVEIGPRFVLNPIRIFRGSFGGQTLYVNEGFVNPNVVRGMEKREKGDKYVRRKGAQRKRQKRDESIIVPDDPLADVFR